jgi:hypothetical protein
MHPKLRSPLWFRSKIALAKRNFSRGRAFYIGQGLAVSPKSNCARARRSSTSATFAAQPFDQKLIRYSFVSLAARHQSLIGPPSHAVRFCDIIANPPVRAQTAPKLECLSQRPIPPALALGAVAEPIRPPACERNRAVRKVELWQQPQMSATSLSETKPYFFKSLRINLRAARRPIVMVAVREGDNVRRFATSSGLIADVFAPNRPVT